MSKCIIGNYSNQEVRVPIKDSDPSIDDLVKVITEKYKRDNTGITEFSLSKSLSLFPEDFEKSIDNFISKIVENLKSQEISFKEDELVNKLKDYYFVSNIDTQEDDLNEANNTTITTISVKEQSALTLKDMLDQFFGESYAVKSHFLQEFKRALKNKTIIHIDETIDKSRIVYDIPTLNQSIVEFQNQLYQQVIGYMKENNIELPADVSNMFIQDEKSKNQYKINPGYIKVLNAFYNTILNNSIYQDQLEIDFHNKILGLNTNNSLLNAVSAFIGITQFNELLEDTLPKYIYIDRDKTSPISYDKSGKPIYKYFINRKNVNLKAGWHSEVSDGIAEMGNFSVMAIESIPVRNKYGTLSKQDFIISFLKLKNLLQNINTNSGDLARAKRMLKSNQVEAWKIALQYIKDADEKYLKGDGTTKYNILNKSLENHRITDNDWNNYISVYDYIFNPKNGVYYIERDSIKTNGITDNYFITNAIFGTLNSTSDLNYMVCEYDQSDKEWKLYEKPKYPKKQTLFQIRTAINRNVISENQEVENSVDFVLNQNPSFKIGKNFIRIVPNEGNVTGIHGIYDKPENFTIYFNGLKIDFNDYFKQQLQDIMYPSKRRVLINNNLEGKNLEFIQTLRLFDNLFGTSYSSSELGLQEFRILYDLDNRALTLGILESAHFMASRTINNMFREAREEDETLTSRDLPKWLEKSDSILNDELKHLSKKTKTDAKKLMAEDEAGNYLIGISFGNGQKGLLNSMAEARTIINGDNNKSTIKNYNNDSVPNASVAYTDFKDELLKQDDYSFQKGLELQQQGSKNELERAPISFLLFHEQADAIQTVVIDSEIKMPDGTSKQVSNFTASELFYHAIFNKFINLSNKSKKWLSQPVTYSDKTKFLNILVNLKSILKTDNIFTLSSGDFEQKMLDTIGKYYNSLYFNIAKDYIKIFELSEFEQELQQLNNLTNIDKRVLHNRYMNLAQRVFARADQEFGKLKLEFGKDAQEEFIDRAYKHNVEVFEDLHYRPGILSTNELLGFLSNQVYSSVNNLHNFLEKEKLNFLNQLLSKYVIFPVKDIKDSLSKNIEDSGEDPNVWFNKKDLLILAKLVKSDGSVTDITTGNQIALGRGDRIILNPILEKYFYMHNLIDNNSKLHFSGNELVHKLKTLGNTSTKFVANMTADEKQFVIDTLGLTTGSQITLSDIFNAIKQNPANIYAKSLNSKLEPILRNVLSAEHLAQFKRTVPIPGTMRLFDQNRIDGIANKYKVSVIKDIQAEVNDFNGNYGYEKSKTIDAHDGSAWVDPFTSILENKSLTDSETGLVKKPLWDIDDHKTGSRRLVKYASNTITNEIMRNSTRGASIDMYKLFKKMTNFRWKGNIDLTHWDVTGWTSNSFKTNILRDNRLFYKFGVNHYEILDFGIENGVYWTKEQRINNFGIPVANSTIIKYHAFNDSGEHIVLDSANLTSELHTIDSLYELHTVFGGINCESMINGQFVYDESSNQVVVAFMNNVTYQNENYRKAREQVSKGIGKLRDIAINQTYYDQPLKKQLINVVINQSAIKNGASNINSSDVYYNDNDLRYTEFDTTKYGIQLDADHNADKAEVTEMSQVISSLDATGLYHDEVSEIYKALGRQTIKASEIEIAVTEEYLKSLQPSSIDANSLQHIRNILKKENLTSEDIRDFIWNNPEDQISVKIQNTLSQKFDKIYDTVGRIIINNIRSNDAGLAKPIINLISQQFNLSENHLYDKFKIPFSDANIYSTILSTLSSVLNSKSIKRKYPGTGQVMIPSYGIYQTWEVKTLDGTTTYLTGEDLLKKAITWNNELDEFQNSEITPIQEGNDIEKFNREVVNLYLQHNIKNDLIYNEDQGIVEDWTSVLSNINPGEWVEVEYYVGEQAYKTKPILLDSLQKYYSFTENPLNYIRDKKINIVATGIKSITRNNKKPKDLAPMRVNFTYSDGINTHSINIFNTWIYRKLFKALQDQNSENEIIKAAAIKTVQDIRKRLSSFLTKLDEGLYEQEDGSDYIITNITKKAAQNIQSYGYRSLFGIKEGDSLNTVREQGINYFKNQFKEYNPFRGDQYDFDFQLRNLNNNNNVYVSINSSNVSNLYTSRQVKWKPSLKRIEDINEGKVMKRVYIMSEDNRKLFEIGRYLDVSDQYKYDSTREVILNTDGEIVNNSNLYYSNRDKKILKYVEFLTKSYISPTNGKRFIKYNIDKEALKEVGLSQDSIGKIVTDIFKSDSYLFIQPSDVLRKNKVQDVIEVYKKLEEDYNGTLVGDLYKSINNNVLKGLNTEKDLIYLNSGKMPTHQELKIFNLKISDGDDIFTILRRNRRNFTEDQIKLYDSLWTRNQQTRLSTHINDFIEKQATERYNSFLKSLYVVSSRIPAQSLQSFMQMETIAFTGANSNVAAVSHFQMFLQGSDLDIDKSYMMGLEMDDNGRYLGWSNLFNLDSLENIEASETLPMPTGRTYTYSQDGLFIDTSEYDNAQGDRARELIALSKILRILNKQSNTKLNISERVLKEINIHESTIISVANEEKILKNFVSSNIQRLIQKTGNILSAYTPIDLDELNAAKEGTPKQQAANDLNLYNPATVLEMQYQNMSGKQVTGITANGQKGQFMWRFETIESIKNGNKDYVTFDITFDRIARENIQEEQPDGTKITKSVPVSKRIQILPNINLQEVADKLRLSIRIAPDIITSQYISAATDNAKELILAVINSGNKMAKCHLYLATLGFDVKDIVKFMTSPAVSFIEDLSNNNIFLGHKSTVENVIEFIKAYNNIYNSNISDEEKAAKLSNLHLKNGNNNLVGVFKERLNKEFNENFYKDTLDFEKVLQGANEFSSLGRLLGINQGVKTTKEELVNFKNFIAKIMSDAEKKIYQEGNERKLDSKQKVFDESEILKYSDIILNGFNVDRWLSEQSYRDLVSDYYNKLKTSINIFYLVDHIPHFKSMFRVANVVNIVDGNLSLKSILYNKFQKELRNKYRFLPKGYEDQLLKAIDEVLIDDFISRLDYRLPLQEGWSTIDQKMQLEKVNAPKTLRVAKNPSAFKYVFENYIIPMLKNVESIKNNYFIQNLIQTEYQGIPTYKANIDMLRKDDSPELYLKYQDFIKGLKELSKYEYSGHSLTDWFVLYNLIVNKNRYGSERLTTLFGDLLKNNQKSLIFQQLKSLGEQDYYKYNLSSLLKDVTLFDLMVKIAPIVSSTIGRQEPVIISHDNNGYVVKEKVGFNSYQDVVKLVIPIDLESQNLEDERAIRQRQYGFGLIYSKYVSNIMKELDNNIKAFNTLIEDGILNYIIKCD